MGKKKLLLITFSIVLIILTATITYSKYQDNATGKVGIEGATWNVSLIGDDDIDLTTGEEQMYSVQVKNNSEVNVIYSIIIENLPDDIKVKLDDNEYVEETDNKIIFTNVGELLVGETVERSHELTFTTPLEAEETENEVSIKVQFKQK